MSELLLYPDENGVLHEAPEFRTVVCFETKEEQERFEKRLNNMNKYRWHDLRKNPDDLPKNEELVLCEWVGGSHNWHDVFMFWEKPRNCFTNTHGTYISIVGDEKFSQEGQVVAWKYIEPFEEEE